ncbi:MAG TPA: sugar phosphate isomerase/epimerase [Chthoniobacterales bacterium]
MKVSQIACQLFTLRDFLKTPADIAATLKKVRAIGYEAVQVSGMGPIPEAELVAICQGEGLTICGTHEPAVRILDETPAVVERLHKLGCIHTAYPFPSGVNFEDPQSVQTLIEKLNAAGQVLHEAGLSLSYHNHGHEFRHLNGKPILQKIYEETDPRYLKAELDTYWVQFGGGDPVAWCRQFAGRLPWLHCKDYGISKKYEPVFTEVGYGNLNWPAILAAAEEGGCGWFIVEQDVCPGDPFDSIRKSFEYLKTHFCN